MTATSLILAIFRRRFSIVNFWPSVSSQLDVAVKMCSVFQHKRGGANLARQRAVPAHRDAAGVHFRCNVAAWFDDKPAIVYNQDPFQDSAYGHLFATGDHTID
jgi:hypothetical protein